MNRLIFFFKFKYCFCQSTSSLLSPNFSFLSQMMAKISPGQTRKQINGVKTEYSLPSAPGDDVAHRLDMELGSSGMQYSRSV